MPYGIRFLGKVVSDMDVITLYSDIMELIAPILTLSGFLALTISLIVTLVNMVINAATGKGFKIGVQ